MALSPRDTAKRRAQRNRTRLRQVANGRPRLSVFRSSKNIYAQVIDDSKGHTVAAASTLDANLKGSLKTGADKAAAAAVGKLVAERALAAGITFAVPKQTEIRIAGIDKQLVGETAARIRRIRPPEPYKGKGVRYAGESVRRKEGKKK